MREFCSLEVRLWCETRQTSIELTLQLPILLVPASGNNVEETTLGALLPRSFGPADLEKPRAPATDTKSASHS